MNAASQSTQLPDSERLQALEGRPPSFVFIGGQRCGTTWAYRCLEEHPEVFTATPKELHFFDRHFDKGADWYLAHFTPGPEHKAWGEVTPAYLSDPDAPERLRQIAPDARLVVCLRNPVDRAFSIHQLQRLQHQNQNKPGKPPTFEQAWEEDPWIKEKGLYAKHLRRWFDVYGRGPVLVLLYEELRADEARFISSIYEHIGVEPGFRPSWLGRTHNAAIMPGLRRSLRKVGLEPAVRAIRDSPVGDAIRRWHRNRGKPSYGPMSADMRRKLEAFYEQPNRQLEELLDVDLSAWGSAAPD